MLISTALLILAVVAVFAVFAVALAYAQIQTRGMIAPGARSLD